MLLSGPVNQREGSSMPPSKPGDPAHTREKGPATWPAPVATMTREPAGYSGSTKTAAVIGGTSKAALSTS